MRSLPALIGFLIILASGLAHGLLTDRWRPSAEVRDAAAALNRVPKSLGNWRGRDVDMDPAQLAIAGATGHLCRRFENRQTGDEVTVMIICGRPGPISLHPPEVCYSGRGYEMAGPPTRLPVSTGQDRTPSEFLVGNLHRPDAIIPDSMRIFWAWKSTGAWQVPADPRLSFASFPYLYKLYAIRGTKAIDEPLKEDPCSELLKQLLPELEKILGSVDLGDRSV